MVKTIVVDSDGIIVGIGNELIQDTKEPGVVWLDGVGYGIKNQSVFQDINIPDSVTPSKYKFIEGEFIKNLDYVPTPEEERQEEINTLRQELEELKQALDMLLGGEDNE